MDTGLKDSVVLVTGGTKGIGLAIALAFQAEGAKVCICARSQQGLDQCRERYALSGYQCDVTSAPSRKNLVESVLGDFGRIDVLVNNAGGSNGSTAMNTDLSLYEEALQLNFLSLVDLSKLVAARMEKGVILNITSISGRESGGRATYNAAKAAAISFTKSFADEMIRKGIRVVGIAPGSILHPTGNWQKRINENPEKMREFVEREIPAGRFGTVEEVASVAVFLASSKASWVVGATLNVDGGQSRMNF